MLYYHRTINHEMLYYHRTINHGMLYFAHRTSIMGCSISFINHRMLYFFY